MIKPKYKIGSVVKFETTLHSLNKEKRWIFGKIVNYYHDEDGKLRYHIDEYPEKSDIMWDCPEDMLNVVSIHEIKAESE